MYREKIDLLKQSGENLSDYFEVEFGVKRQEDIAFGRIRPVPFWSEIM